MELILRRPTGHRPQSSISQVPSGNWTYGAAPLNTKVKTPPDRRDGGYRTHETGLFGASES
jgi:hypothetical protein